MLRRFFAPAAAVCAALAASPALAGVVNPDISVIGQPFFRFTDDPNDPDPNRLRLDVGETEFMFDAALNPYAHGTFVASLGSDGSMSLEEGYFTLLRGLPLDLQLKGGKYRVGFGKLNPAHPHAYPFADRFRVLAAYLPGDESLDETGISLSERLPAPGDMALTASVDYLQGDTFRRERAASGAANDPLAVNPGGHDDAAQSRPAVLGRLSAFNMLGDQSALELGLSALHGTNNVAAAARTTVLGADAKAKLWTSDNAYLVLQGEALKLSRDDAGWDSTAARYTLTNVNPFGMYVFADFNWSLRYNAGVSFETFQEPTGAKPWDHAFGAFAGLALMEETTAFRLDWNRLVAGSPGSGPAPAAVNTVTLRVIYSMGPHKAHQF